MNKIQVKELLLATLLCSSSFSVVFPINGIVVFVILASFILMINKTGGYKLSDYKFSLNFTFAIVLFTLLQYPFAENTNSLNIYFFHFVIFGIPFLFIPFEMDYSKVIRYILIYSLIFAPFYATRDYHFSISDSTTDYDASSLMTMSYRILPYIVAAVWGIKNGNKLFKALSLLSLVVYITLLMVLGSRGAIVSIFVFILLYIINIGEESGKRYLKIILITFIIVIGVFYMTNIIEWMMRFADSYNINSLPLQRMYFKLQEGDGIDSGRNILSARALEDFWSSPLIGCGIGSFDGGHGYPHNFVLHIMQEWGMLGLIPLIIVSMKSLGTLLKGNIANPYFQLLVLIFCSGVVQLFFSFYYWGSQFFWFFLYMVIYRKKIDTYKNL